MSNTGNVADYTQLYKLQDSRQEEIDYDVMHECIKNFVKNYRENNQGKTPTKVVVYRDGVSESQYEMVSLILIFIDFYGFNLMDLQLFEFQVLKKETYALKEALLEFCQDAIPVTIIVCQKRHHTRFFPVNMNPNAKARDQNISAGTVVDTGPVSTSLFDFYLASHTGLQVSAILESLVLYRFLRLSLGFGEGRFGV